MNRIELKIGGMSCEGCVRTLTRVLGRVDGVTVGDVGVGHAGVSVPSADDATLESVRAAVVRAGFDVLSIEAST